MKFVKKGWGHELWIHNDEKYCGKLVHFDKGRRCSLHYHKLKHETFYLHSGHVTLTVVKLDRDPSEIDDELRRRLSMGIETPLSGAEVTIRHMHSGDVFEIPPGMIHQVYAHDESDIFECSTQHFDSDSIRIVRGD